MEENGENKEPYNHQQFIGYLKYLKTYLKKRKLVRKEEVLNRNQVVLQKEKKLETISKMPKTWRVFQNNFRNIIKEKKENDNTRNFGESIFAYQDRCKTENLSMNPDGEAKVNYGKLKLINPEGILITTFCYSIFF
jgi:hypothetical protein